MNPSPELNTILKQLRLSGVLDSLEQRNRQAIDGQLAYTEFLAMLLHDEVARRDQKKLGARLLRAGFGLGKTLETFDFDRLPKLNRAHIHDLATGRYIDEKVAILMVGQTGVGKSHIAQALGHRMGRRIPRQPHPRRRHPRPATSRGLPHRHRGRELPQAKTHAGKQRKRRCKIRQKNAFLNPFEIAFRGHSEWPHYADHPRLDYADP
jgi:hypothetical protein